MPKFFLILNQNVHVWVPLMADADRIRIEIPQILYSILIPYSENTDFLPQKCNGILNWHPRILSL